MAHLSGIYSLIHRDSSQCQLLSNQRGGKRKIKEKIGTSQLKSPQVCARERFERKSEEREMINEEQLPMELREQIKNCIYNLLRIYNQVPEIDRTIRITRRLQPEQLNRQEQREINRNCRPIEVIPKLYEQTFEQIKEKMKQFEFTLQEFDIDEKRLVIDKEASVRKIKEILDWCERVRTFTLREGEAIRRDVQHLSEGLKDIAGIQKFISSEKKRLLAFLERYQRR